MLFKSNGDTPDFMSFLHLFILSVVQGLTEFLPVSSSGHLVLAPRLLGMPDQGILIDVALHVGTLLAILTYYRRDIFDICLAVLRWNRVESKPARNLGIYIAVGSIPAVLAGAAIHHFFPEGIRSVGVIVATTLGFGLLMGFADLAGQQEKEAKDATLKSAVLIGCAQAIALIPGTSRSGITMTAARFLGFKRVEAARFSFLLGIPAMAGAGALALLELMEKGNGLWHDALIAVALAFVAGLGAIHIMIKCLQGVGLMPFVIYRMFLGGFLLVYFIVLGGV